MGQIGGVRVRNPLADTRDRLGLCGAKYVGLEFLTFLFGKPRLKFAVLHQFAQIASGSSLNAAFSKLAVDGQGVASASHRHVEKPAFLLLVHKFLIAVGSEAGVAKLIGELNQRLAVAGGKAVANNAQNENVVEFKAFSRVC